MKGKQAFWTDDDDQKLLEAIGAGVSPARAAVMFKRTIQSVRRRAYKLGKPFAAMHVVKRARDAKIAAATKE